MTFNLMLPILAQGRALESSISCFSMFTFLAALAAFLFNMALPISSALKLALEQRHIAGPLVLANLTLAEVSSILNGTPPTHSKGLELVLATATSLEDQQLEILRNMSLADETEVMRVAERATRGLLLALNDCSTMPHPSTPVPNPVEPQRCEHCGALRLPTEAELQGCS